LPVSDAECTVAERRTADGCHAHGALHSTKSMAPAVFIDFLLKLITQLT
jgi:hypothetical protein